MKTYTEYRIDFSYNYGLLSNSVHLATAEAVKVWEEMYKTEFPDARKWFMTYKVSYKKFFGKKIFINAESVNFWEEIE
jgi:hypothetical protein